MRKTLGLLVAFCALPGIAQLQENQSTGVMEKWQCLSVMDWLAYQFEDADWDQIPDDKIVVTLTRSTEKDDKAGSAEVSITGITHRATFSVEGLERRWDFGENGEYAFFINPQGGGAYFDFSDAEVGEKVEPSLTLGCINEAEARRKAEESRKRAEEAAAAQRRIEEAERLTAETERRKRDAEMAEQLRREMSEERRSQAIESGLLDQYKAHIRQRIESNWQRPADGREDLMWVVLLDMLPGNEVEGITFEEFNGSEADRRSIETAIRRSSPLPEPPAPELFERQLRLRYPAIESGISALEGETVPIVLIDPQWPHEALMNGTEGYVNFEVLIGADGGVIDARVTEAAPGRIFVRNAERAIRRWKFKPRIVNGEAVEFWTRASIVFHLDG